MEKNLATDRNDIKRPLEEPVVLTPAETNQVAAGLSQAVAAISARGCPTCGRGGAQL